MTSLEVRPGVTIAYADDCFGAPWLAAETVVLLHGIAESSRAWTEWVPTLSGAFRVLRPDLPGFGASPAPARYDWSPAMLAADVVRWLDALGVKHAHVVGAKYGGTVAMQLAADHPDRVLTLAVVSSPVRAHATGGRVELGGFADRIRRDGVRAWAAATQRTRLGGEASDAQLAWWTDVLMAASDPGACIAATEAAGRLDIEAALPRIAAPTLVVTTEESALQSLDTVRRWQARIPRSTLLVLPGDCYHVAAVRPEECARHVRRFIESRTPSPCP